MPAYALSSPLSRGLDSASRSCHDASGKTDLSQGLLLDWERIGGT